MTQDEIIEMAQECKLIGMRPHLDGIYSESLVAFANLIYVKALAQPESWEKFCDSNCVWTDHHPDCRLAQTQEVGLTVDELIDLEHKHLSHENLTRAIEAKLKEKNT